ncbi:MAG: cytochrome c [Acidobacteria bacterium]|nr:cytochrome c [Acidobacteriota bacterium]
MTKTLIMAVSLVLLTTGAAVRTTAPASAQALPAGQRAAPPVTFHKDVLPLLQKNCQSCHRPGQIGPFSMLTYKDARPWAKAMKQAVITRAMPPWFADPGYGHFNNDRSLKQADIDTIVAWVDQGAPEGDAHAAPPPIAWPEGGWQIAPDVSVDLPPYPVPARGIVEWERVAFPAPFKEDTWVTSVEILPGVPAVVHHMCFGFQKHKETTPYNEYQWMEVPRDENGNMQKVDGTTTGPLNGVVLSRTAGSTEVKRRIGRPEVFDEGTNEFCYLPGLPYEDYRPVHAGVFVPAGSDMIVSLHYTATGLAVTDKSRIGFTVTKTPPAKTFVPQDGAEGDNPPVARKQANASLAIPPYANDFPGPMAEVAFLKDVELVWFRPHAHVRGKTVRYTLVYPDGREETLLYVPRYNFNWQLTYRTSVKIPKGAKMRVQFTYDNSTANKYNPDPGRWVRYGGQSWEEMGTPNMGFLIDRGADVNGVLLER